MRSRVLLLIFSLCFTGSVSAQNFDPKRIYQKTSNAVVLVAAFERGGKYTSSGTGSIINEDGLILTNAHVIFNSDRNKTFEELLIFLKPDKVTGNLKKDTSRKFKASLVRYSNQLDLALLKIDKNNANIFHSATLFTSIQKPRNVTLKDNKTIIKRALLSLIPDLTKK